MQEHEHWLAYAEDDLKVAKVIFNSEHISIAAVLFHSQQCAEKALKGYLVYNDIQFHKTRDLAL